MEVEKYKPMKYKDNMEEPILLANVFYKGYEFFVISLGCHPCAYVRLKKRKYNNYDEYNEKIYVHGEFTYLENHLYIGKNVKIENEFGFLGWDYAHEDDYNGVTEFSVLSYSYFVKNKNGKKRTTEEIVKECFNVIEQLIKIDCEEN